MSDMTLSKLELRFHCEGASTTLDPRRLDGVEEVGRPTRLDLEVFASAPLDDVVGLVGAPCALSVASPLGSRVIHGVVLAITQKASALGDGARLYRVEMASALAVLGLRRDHRVFQKLTGPDLVSQLLDEGGARPAGRELSGEHPAIRYVTQYAETNLDFLRRLCEEDGLWYRFEPRDGFDEVVLGDDVEGAPESSLGEPLLLTEEAGLGADVPRAWQVEVGRARAVGAVTMSGYAFRNPAAAVTGDAELGSDVELPSRCYRVAPRATTAAEATRAAQIAVEAARAESRRVRFTTSAFVLQPGRRFELEPDVGYTGPVPERSLFVTSVEHRYDGSLYTCQVEAVPRSQPYRLPQKTPRPHIAGVQTAIVTGPPGEEIFTDEDGCVRVRFHWDRFGPTDQESSLPVRVLHPNLAGSMLIPRIGWEVWVAFEDGDPDRPFVIGRAYNGKHGPPVALPVNKTMTMLSTSSSPGAGAVNSVSFEDAAGRQGMNWNAGLGLTQTVGNDASIQTVADEKVKVDGSVAISVGGNQKEAVIQGRTVSTPAQLIRVGGSQKLKTPAASTVQTGSEDIVCSVLMEQVGSPGGALGALGIQAGMTVGGMIPGVGLLLGAGKAAYDAYDAYQKDGVGGAIGSALRSGFGMIPVVGDALDVVDAGGHSEKDVEKKKPAKGSAESSQVGGADAASASDAQQGGGGNRTHSIGGATLEAIGGAYSVTTPGENKWTTLGASTFAVGGAHVTTAGDVSWTFGGASVHTTGAYAVSASTIARDLKTMTTTAASLSMTGADGVLLQGSSITIACGPLSVAGTLVIMAGGTKVVVDGSGLTVHGAEVTFSGPVNCGESHRS